MKKSRTVSFALLVIFILSGGFAAGWYLGQRQTAAPEPQIKADETVLEASSRIMRLIKARDYAGLSKTVHSHRGVSFSPYYLVEPAENLNLSAEKMSAAASDTTVYNWGLSPARGDEIKLTIPEYFNQYVFPHDYTNPEIVSINKITGPGGTAETIREAYPGSEFVEFYFSGFDPKYEGMDWASTRLVLMKENGEWKLAGVIAGYWTV